MQWSEMAGWFDTIKQQTGATDTAVALMVLAEALNKFFDPNKFGDVIFDGIARALREPLTELARTIERVADAADHR